MRIVRPAAIILVPDAKPGVSPGDIPVNGKAGGVTRLSVISETDFSGWASWAVALINGIGITRGTG